MLNSIHENIKFGVVDKVRALCRGGIPESVCPRPALSCEPSMAHLGTDLAIRVRSFRRSPVDRSIVLYEVLRRWGKYESVAAVRLAG